jgi:hypothetical protein
LASAEHQLARLRAPRRSWKFRFSVAAALLGAVWLLAGVAGAAWSLFAGFRAVAYTSTVHKAAALSDGLHGGFDFTLVSGAGALLLLVGLLAMAVTGKSPATPKA